MWDDDDWDWRDTSEGHGAAGHSEAMGEEHADGGHADRPRPGCWVCQGE
jgi:hypothetical protein